MIRTPKLLLEATEAHVHNRNVPNVLWQRNEARDASLDIRGKDCPPSQHYNIR